MPRREVAKWFFEGALIVFSVLIALVINETVENRKVRNEKRAAMERIVLELQGNSEILQRWQARHSEFGGRLTAIIEDRESQIRDQLLASGYFDLGLVFGGESFIDAGLSNSAWEATREKGLVTELEYETVQKLTDAYSLQQIISEQTIARFSALYFDRETHSSESLDGTLIQFQLIAGELVAQEATLAFLYREALNHLGSLER